MYSLISILVVMVVGLALAALYFFLYARREKGTAVKKKRQKRQDRNTVIKSANRKLSQDPKDPEALLSLASLYYQEEDYEKAYRYYNTLADLCAIDPELDEFDIALRRAISALKLKNYEEAYKGLIYAKSISSESFEVNFHLGYLEYLRKSYEKAASLLSLAKRDQPDHFQTIKYLGLSLFRDKRYDEAMKVLKSAITYEPNDKEALFILGQCYYELGSNDNALRTFTHLRTDPKLGPHACLFAGTINMNSQRPAKAIDDFKIGLRHPNLKISVENELKYRLSAAYFKERDIEKAITLLKEIVQVNPDYKDTRDLIDRYQELSKSRILQAYLISLTSEFVTLCRKIAASYFERAKGKLKDISIMREEYVDILAEIHTNKWEDLVLFRFIRSVGVVGELAVRDFYTRCRDLKTKRGVCICAGEFSESARHYVEARLIELVNKEGLMRLFERLSGFSDMTQQQDSTA
jgi:tetratricopeptide (TPR) repeat protein